MTENAAAATDASLDAAPPAPKAEIIPAPALAEFQSHVEELQAAAREVEVARESHRRAFVDLCTKIYVFKHAYDEEKIEEWLAAKGLKVTAKANEWTPVVKLAFAVKQEDKTWTVSNQQVNKYANVMRYAESLRVRDMEKWISDRTLTELLAAARLALKDAKKDDEKPNDKIERYLNELKQKWESFFEKGMPRAVDLTQAPVQPGRVQILADVDDKGNITPVGIVQAEQPKLLNLLAPAKAKTPTADDLSQSVWGVKALFPFADFVWWSSKDNIARYIILDVAKDKWRMYVCGPKLWSCPIAEAVFAQPHQQLPVGKWFFHSEMQKALRLVLNTFPEDMIAVSSNGTHCLITIKDSVHKTVEAHIEEINEKKVKNWKFLKTSGKKVPRQPSKFNLPAEFRNDSNTLLLPDASGLEVARLHRDVKWLDTGITASRQFRNEVAAFCDEFIENKTFYRVRFGATQMSFFFTHGGDAIKSIKYGKKAKDKLEEYFAINKYVLGRAMAAMNFAIDTSPCQLSISDGKSVLRLSAEHNGGTYNIYIPNVGVGNEYDGAEFSRGRLAP
jgi:hypothetical protein